MLPPIKYYIITNKKLNHLVQLKIKMAGVERIELPTAVLETVIIPFNYTPKSVDTINYSTLKLNIQEKMHII